MRMFLLFCIEIPGMFQRLSCFRHVTLLLFLTWKIVKSIGQKTATVLIRLM